MAKFRTRARTIDLLGRQQIAGIPTAISELFKNAHDAYADHVEVDYFRHKRLFILRDDGLGMTLEDFENRWLILGTESKCVNMRTTSPPIDMSKPRRPVMGEKGIGRLAVSAIGRQVLIITRSRRDGVLGNCVAALINWGVFEVPGLNLDDVIIPLRQFDNGQVPTIADVESMKLELIGSINCIFETGDMEKKEFERLTQEINEFIVNPYELGEKLPGQLSLSNSSGTQFYISAINEVLNQDIDPDDNKKASKLEKALIGFTNIMIRNNSLPAIQVVFRDHIKEDGTYIDRIDRESFFTEQDSKDSDHHIVGEFDIYGHFAGTVSVYHEEPVAHKINWTGSQQRPTECGPFSINFYYLQGKYVQSQLDQIRHSALSSKLDRFGGIYLYRDGIRILPYGDNDYDFLDIEKNRSKSANFYFFSYRRMFGFINITKADNPSLIEKSGREGFIENKAYRQIQAILKNFFVSLAADFFRENSGSPYVDVWAQRRSERERFFKTQKARENRAKEKKNRFVQAMKSFFYSIESGEIQKNISSLLNDADIQFATASSIPDPDEAAQSLIDREFEVRKNLNSLRAECRLSAPRGFALTNDLSRDWESYLDRYQSLETEFFVDTEKKILGLVDRYRREFNLQLSKRKRIEKSLDEISIDATQLTRQRQGEALTASKNVAKKVRDITSELMKDLEQKIRGAKSDLSSVGLSNADDTNIYEELRYREMPIVQGKEYATYILDSIIEQLDSICFERDQDGNIVTGRQIEAAMEEEIGALKEKIITDVELTQLGLAVNIIHHEFNSAVTSMRQSIRDLKRWADVNDKLETIYNNVRVNFEHLDGYLSLLTPFNRRLYRNKETIKADEIYIFLQDVFKGRLERHHITLSRTKMFLASKILGYRSVFYPVFVNIVDNAIHWLKQREDNGERLIRIHSDNHGIFYISNNGPEIRSADLAQIFELGFSRKANGRGMGLAISKEILNGVDYVIDVDAPRKDCNVTFRIRPKI